MEPISPSVWRSAKRNTARSVRAVRIARSEYRLPAACGAGLSPPGGDRFIGEPDRQAAPLTQARVYSAQFVTRCRCLGMR